jgi:hypothetical protein
MGACTHSTNQTLTWWLAARAKFASGGASGAACVIGVWRGGRCKHRTPLLLPGIDDDRLGQQVRVWVHEARGIVVNVTTSCGIILSEALTLVSASWRCFEPQPAVLCAVPANAARRASHSSVCSRMSSTRHSRALQSRSRVGISTRVGRPCHKAVAVFLLIPASSASCIEPRPLWVATSRTRHRIFTFTAASTSVVFATTKRTISYLHWFVHTS